MSKFGNLVNGQTHIDFRVWWKRGLTLSAVLIVISIGALFTRELNLGIDFEGGTAWEVIAPDVSVPEARDAMEALGQGDAKVQIVGSDTLRIQSSTTDPAEVAEVRQGVAELAGVDTSEVSVSTVGPSWGDNVTRSAARALVIFVLVILVYLTIRLEWEMAVGAIAAVLHDVIISVGVYALFQFEVTPGTVVAFLTILGYSIYDTIVVYDKIKENDARVGLSQRMTYTDMASMSMNQVLLRSLNTSVTSLLPVLAILVIGSGVMGAVTLQEFGIALFVGMVSGVYSSIFVATPIVVMIKEREKKFRVIRERIGATSGSSGPIVEGAIPASASPVAAAATGTSSPASGVKPTHTGAIPPRPRKKTKRR